MPQWDPGLMPVWRVPLVKCVGLECVCHQGSENTVRCGRCNLQRWWHCLKKCGKRKAAVNFCGTYWSWRAPWIVTASAVCEHITAVWEGAEDLFFSLRLCRLPERRVGVRAVCTRRLWAATCCNLYWSREQHSRHKSPRQLLNSFNGLEREGWPFKAPVLVYCPRLPALPSCWPLPSVWVDVSRNQGCLWNLTWCAVEGWPDYHWPFVRSEERLQSRALSFSSAWAVRSKRGRGTLPPDITAGIKRCCCFATNKSFIQIKMPFFIFNKMPVLRNKAGIWRIYFWMIHHWSRFQAFPSGLCFYWLCIPH